MNNITKNNYIHNINKGKRKSIFNLDVFLTILIHTVLSSVIILIQP